MSKLIEDVKAIINIKNIKDIDTVLNIKSTEDKEEDKYIAILPRYKNNENSIIAQDLVHLYFSIEKFKKNKLDTYTQTKLNDLKNHINTEFCMQSTRNYQSRIVEMGEEEYTTSFQMKFINKNDNNKSLILNFSGEAINYINLTSVEENVFDNKIKKTTKYTV